MKRKAFVSALLITTLLFHIPLLKAEQHMHQSIYFELDIEQAEQRFRVNDSGYVTQSEGDISVGTED